MKKKFITLSMLTLLILAFIYSAYQLFQVMYIYHSSFYTYEKVKNVVSDKRKGDSTVRLPDIDIHFEQLKRMNPDAIAWIIIPNTPINYPVVQTTNNSFYLNHTINKEKNLAGCIFVDYENLPNFTDLHTLLYGHNLKNGMMFAALNNYADKDFWRKNPCFWILTPEHKYCYQIFSTYLTAAEVSKSYQIEFQNLEEYQNFIYFITKKANYKTNTNIRVTDKIVSLSTCTNQDRFRRIVHGKLVSVQ